MSSPLKNVSVQELEKAIAEALQKFASEERKFTISIKELKFEGVLPRVDIALSAWERTEGERPFEKFI